MSAIITSIGRANPAHIIPQSEVVEFMIRAHKLDDQEAHDLRVLYRATGIQQRFTSIQDYGATEQYEFFPNNADLSPFPSTSVRADWYRRNVVGLSIDAVRGCLTEDRYSEITHLITVSCTGMYAPGLDIDLINELGLKPGIERTCINFMGCYAAFNALKLAKHICDAGNAKVLIVSVELCTLHFQKDKSEDNLLANALFGDGAAAALVETEGQGLELNHFKCDLLPRASEEMAWEIGDFGFEMRLSSYVPDVIQQEVGPMVDQLKEEANVKAFDFYAIHPGGKRILSVMEAQLGISKAQNRFAHEILRSYGNMSSPTILFVLEQLMDSLEGSDNGKHLLGFAFGPGLTMESVVAKIRVS